MQPHEPICSTCQRPTSPNGACNYCLLKLGKSDRQSIQSVSAVDLPTPEQLQQSFPQLEITRLIGRGGMGAIYHARQRSLDRDVALKIIARNLSDDPSFEERFTREAKTLARLSHPNIVAVYDFGSTDDGLVYLLMEYVDGVNLREAMDAGGIRSDEAIQIVAEMCAALQFAHDRGVVHRDIKPENVLLNEDGVVKVADFGLAKLLNDSPANLTLTNTRQVMGTLRYMAPEQFENPSSVDHRADVYSLGVVFYELLTGQVPVGRFDVPSRINESVSPKLDEIVMRTLDRKPPNRYQRVSEIASELSNMEIAAVVSGTLPPAYVGNVASETVAFSASAFGNLAVSVGNIKLDGDSLEVNYLTRDNICHLVKTGAKSIRVPLSELAKLEWRPGVFKSTITIAPKSLSLAGQLPGAQDGFSELTIRMAESQAAARLVAEAAKLAPSLRATSTNILTQKIAQGLQRLSWVRTTLGVLFLVLSALNVAGMVVALVRFGSQLDENPEFIFPIVIIPIFTTVTFVLQLIGGIFCFSPYTRRMPLAAATISILPMAIFWPLGIVVGVWAWFFFLRDETRNGQDRGIPLLHGLLGGSTSRMQTTLLYLREHRWSRFVAAANVLGLLALGSVFALYTAQYYPVSLDFRVVAANDAMVASGVEYEAAVNNRLAALPRKIRVAEFQNGILRVECLKSDEVGVRQALSIADRIEYAWVINPDGDTSGNAPAERTVVGGTISSGLTLLSGSIHLASAATTIDSSFCKSISTLEDNLEIFWTVAGREAIQKTKPKGQVLGLVLIIDGLVEGFAPIDAEVPRAAIFSMAEGSEFEPPAIQAAIRGPSLSIPLEFLRTEFGPIFF